MTLTKAICLMLLQLFVVTSCAEVSEWGKSNKTTTKPAASNTNMQHNSTAFSSTAMFKDNKTLINYLPNINKPTENKKAGSKSFKDMVNKNLRKLLIVGFLNKPNETSREMVINASREYHNRVQESADCTTQKQNCTAKNVGKQHQIEINRTVVIQMFERATMDYMKFYLNTEHVNKLRSQYKKSKKLSDIRALIREMGELTRLQRNFVETMKSPNVIFFEVMHEMRNELNITAWEADLEKKEKELMRFEEIEFRLLLQDYIQPVLQGIIFVVGFVSNGVLLLIFLRHKDMRTSPNIMLINLMVGDLLNLLINIPVFYSYSSSTSWTLGVGLCKCYRFFRRLCTGVCVYSVVVISVQRYFAFTRFVGYNKYTLRLTKTMKSILIVSSVWITSSLIAIPHSIHAGIYKNNCFGFSLEAHKTMLKVVTMVDAVALCVVPVLAVSIFSMLSSKKLKKSVKTIPGEAVGMERMKRARIVSSKILIALSIVFVISYGPYCMFEVIGTWTALDISPSVYYVSFLITYTLLFGNACFSPIALYIVCGKLRRKVNRYFACKNKNKLSEESNPKTTIVTLSTMDNGSKV
ncbi:phe13-bombesin receptor-like [Periplaneta americana]|uniref:phe13-bombesin receptor-like n=1 Tax=Periplaneta americana TaxID=6978 RepID=UPI0037E7BA39